MAFDIKNERLSDEEFFQKRKEVLKQWETGRQVENLDENIAIAKELSQGKSYALTLAEHKKNGTNIFEPQFGQALTEARQNVGQGSPAPPSAPGGSQPGPPSAS